MRLSIVIPTRHRPYLLQRALRSLEPMVSGDIEVIVVDDGPDELVATLAAGAPFPVVLERLGGGGVSAARNLGATRARGRLLAYLDDDDEWIPPHPEALVTSFDRHPHLRLVCADAICGNDDTGFSSLTHARVGTTDLCHVSGSWLESGLWEFDGTAFFFASLSRNLLSVGAWVVDRDTFLGLGGFQPQLSAGEDWEFYLRISAAHPVAFLSGPPVARVHVHAANVSTDDVRMRRGYVDSLAALIDSPHLPATLRPAVHSKLLEHLTGLAYELLDAGDRVAARRAYRRIGHQFGYTPSLVFATFKTLLPRRLASALAVPLRLLRR